MPTRSRNGKTRTATTAARKKAPARKAPARQASKRGSQPTDVLSLLHRDHETVGAMIDEIPDCEPGDERLRELARSMADALTVHAKIEEDLFYPELRDRSEDDEQLTDVFEAYTEHDVIKHLLALLKSEKGPDEKFKAELQVLGESVKHHVKEEESTIFKLARKFMSRDELEECGQEMAAEKERLQASPARR
ncbi:MAG: hemerythrin domain-containing protein [Candidatus Tumulicola sp.]